MPNPFAKIAFTDSVKRAQQHYGTRRANERLESHDRLDELTANEAAFIRDRDGFYMATVNENGHPYVQFRGGPKGFLKTLDERTLGFADFRGNLQYISVGNLRANNNAALILMDYPKQARLKILAEIEVLDLSDDPDLMAKLTVEDYPARIERAMILHVTAYDWNCPQHITPRFTLGEVEAGTEPLRQRIRDLEAEIAALRIAKSDAGV
jgi:Predicted flavin-nucleotide-binding protein structurally related to pyridoxine 5''-phosphate oxidase